MATRNVAAVTMNTVSTFVATRRTPPIAGPTKLPMLAIVLVATFAAVGSSGVRARVGRIAASAGRNTVPSRVTKPAIA